jgi:hypothetical protein
MFASAVARGDIDEFRVKREQVLIRYRIGDRAIRGPADPCACGRQMPRVEQETGRVENKNPGFCFHIPYHNKI